MKKDIQIVRFDWVKPTEGNKGSEWCVEVQVGVTASGRPDIVGPMAPSQAEERYGITLPTALKAIGVEVLKRCEGAEAAHEQALRDHEATRTELIQAQRHLEHANTEMGRLRHLHDLALAAAEAGSAGVNA